MIRLTIVCINPEYIMTIKKSDSRIYSILHLGKVLSVYIAIPNFTNFCCYFKIYFCYFVRAGKVATKANKVYTNIVNKNDRRGPKRRPTHNNIASPSLPPPNPLGVFSL